MGSAPAVEPFTTFLVVSADPPHIFGVDRAAIKHLDPNTGRGRTGAGSIVRRTIAESPADMIVMLDDPNALTVGWLVAAAAKVEAGAAAVVVGVDEAYRDSVAPIGAATVFDADTLREIGGFLPAFDTSVAALDALWRMQTRGLQVSVLEGFASRAPQHRVRPSDLIAIAASNLGRDAADRLLAEATLELITGPIRDSGADPTALDLERSPGGDDVGHLAVPASTLSGVEEIRRALWLIRGVVDSRRIAEKTRRLSDRFLARGIAVFGEQLNALAGVDAPQLSTAAFGPLETTPIKVCVVTQAALEPEASAIWLRLAERFDVRWACVDDDQVCVSVKGAWQPIEGEEIVDQRDWADAVVLKDVLVRSVPWLAGRPLPTLVDATGWHFGEILEAEYPGMMGLSDNMGVHTVLVGETLERADLVLTRDLDHRDRILGWMGGLGRVNPLIYDEDHSLANLVAHPTRDLESEIAAWCERPRRAADLVSSYPRTAQPKSSPLKAVAKKWRR